MRDQQSTHFIRRIAVAGAVLAALGAGLSVFGSASAFARIPTIITITTNEITVSLHNNNADEESCAGVPGLVGPAWHFVAPSGDFVSINWLLVGGVKYSNPAYLSYPSTQHAYVTVPAGKAIGDLEDGSFTITGATKVVLSHTCAGIPATTTTTTTAPEETTTTTTAPEKTTTTTTTTTTIKVGSNPIPPAVVPPAVVPPAVVPPAVVPPAVVPPAVVPPAVVPPAVVPTTTQLPATGNSSWTVFFVGMATLMGGLGLVKLTRRSS